MCCENRTALWNQSRLPWENGEIEVLVVASDRDGIGHGGFVLKPTDPEYDEYKTRFILVNAGDWSLIERELIDGKRVDLPPRPCPDLPKADPTEGKLYLNHLDISNQLLMRDAGAHRVALHAVSQFTRR